MSLGIIISEVKNKAVAENLEFIDFNFERSAGNFKLKKDGEYQGIKIICTLWKNKGKNERCVVYLGKWIE